LAQVEDADSFFSGFASSVNHEHLLDGSIWLRSSEGLKSF